MDDFISRVHAHKRERENGEFWGTFLSKSITFYAHEYITNMQQNTSASFKTCGVQRGAVSRAASVMYRGTIDNRHVFVGGVLGFGW